MEKMLIFNYLEGRRNFNFFIDDYEKFGITMDEILMNI